MRMDSRFQNHVTLLGRVARRPNSHGEGKREIVFFDLITKSYFRNWEGEDNEDEHCHKIMVTSRNEFVQGYVKRNLEKGDRVYLEGSLKYKEKEGEDGRSKKVPAILLEDLVIVAKAYD